MEESIFERIKNGACSLDGLGKEDLDLIESVRKYTHDYTLHMQTPELRQIEKKLEVLFSPMLVPAKVPELEALSVSDSSDTLVIITFRQQHYIATRQVMVLLPALLPSEAGSDYMLLNTGKKEALIQCAFNSQLRVVQKQGEELIRAAQVLKSLKEKSITHELRSKTESAT